MSFLLLALFMVFLMFLLVAFYRFGVTSEAGGDACQPDEVLTALQWEVKGTYASGRFDGRHRDRNIEIHIQAGHYRIAIEGTPEAGDLEGAEALRHIEALSRSPEGLKLEAVPDWGAIVRVFHAHPFRFEGGRLLSTATFGGGVLGTHEEAIRLRRLIERLIEVTKVAQVALSLRAKLHQDTRCPYCHDAFDAAVPDTQCPKCSARHHVDCFAEHGQCAVFACSAPVPQALRDLAGPGKASGGSIRSV
ncbi:MAG: hypothetical protein ACAI25_11175 [Planctomycetota bacterium]